MVHVIDNYYFDADSNCYTAYEDTLKKDKNNEPIYRTIGYYQTSKQAVEGIAKYMQKKIAGKDENIELSEFVRECEDINIQLRMTLDDIFKAVDF